MYIDLNNTVEIANYTGLNSSEIAFLMAFSGLVFGAFFVAVFSFSVLNQEW
jgi:hypothetical protein